MLLSKILENIPYEKIEGDMEIQIENMYYDSRQITPNSIFFCIRGFNIDRHDFAEDAVGRGARALVVERDVAVPDNITKIFVEDARLTMSLMAANFYGRPAEGMKVVGITGTNGKTSMAYFLKSILERAGLKVGLVGTITNMIGNRIIEDERTTPTTPESLDLQRLFRQMVDEGVQVAVMEVTSHSLSLKRVGGIEFDLGIFTNLTQDHLDFHKTFENYRAAKMELFKNSKVSIINIDDESGRFIAENIDGEVLPYGICSKDCKVFARDIDITPRGASFNMYIKGERSSVELNIPGIFSVYNSLAAGAAAHVLGFEAKIIESGLGDVHGIPGRFEHLKTDTDYTIIIDYAHTPDGLENVLETAKSMATGRLITLFGCGGDRDREKRPLMGKVAGAYSHMLIVTSDNPRTEDPMSIIEDIIPGVLESQCPYVVIENRKQAIEYALANAELGDIVILAGKGHETYQILKDRTIHFDEREIVTEFLEKGRA